MDLEMGPCAKFSLYHLMELEAGEERLAPMGKKSTDSKAGQLLHASIATIGKAQPLVSDSGFRAEIALRQDAFPLPPPDKATSVQQDPKAKYLTPPKTLSDISEVLRSKNAGPYEITIDVMFHTELHYLSVKKSNFLSRENVARALGVSEDDIVWMGFYEPALAFKVTIPRFRGGKKSSAGSFMENDIHGSQQHLGISSLELPGATAPTMLASAIQSAWDQPWYKALAVTAAVWGVSTSARRLLYGKRR